MKDVFDLWWQWAEKPHESLLMIDADIHKPIMEVLPGQQAQLRCPFFLLQEQTSPGHPGSLFRADCVAKVESCIRPTFFGETFKRAAIDDSDNLSRATEVAYEFSVGR